MSYHTTPSCFWTRDHVPFLETCDAEHAAVFDDIVGAVASDFWAGKYATFADARACLAPRFYALSL